jgi:hypothetical protein
MGGDGSSPLAASTNSWGRTVPAPSKNRNKSQVMPESKIQAVPTKVMFCNGPKAIRER